MRGFSITETLIGLLMVSIAFGIVGSGLSVVLQSMNATTNMQKVVELQNFASRYINVVGTSVTAEVINLAFHNGRVGYPRLAPINPSTDVQTGTYYVKYRLRIQSFEGQKPENFVTFYVYRYRQY